MNKRTKKPVLMQQGHTSEMYTPRYAINPLLPYLDKSMIVWEPAWGMGDLAFHLNKEGFQVVGSPGSDFFKVKNMDFDIMISNPPYDIKDEWLSCAFEWDKPFAFLFPLTILEGIKRGSLFRENYIQLIIPNRRINFITPNGGKSSWFATCWVTYKLDLPHQLNFVELERDANKWHLSSKHLKKQ